MDPLPRCHLRDTGLGFSHFARHYFGNHSLFSLPQGTEMFHFPWLAPASLFIQLEVTPLFTVLGFPIRTSPDQRSVDSSPKLFAATRVLHRLLAPRHPPHALSSLLASISCLRPASQRSLETRNQGPDPCSSQQARKTHSIRLIREHPLASPRRRLTAATGLVRVECLLRELITQQKLQLTLRMHLSKNARRNGLVGRFGLSKPNSKPIWKIDC